MLNEDSVFLEPEDRTLQPSIINQIRSEVGAAVLASILQGDSDAADSWWLTHAAPQTAGDVPFTTISDALVYFMSMITRGGFISGTRLEPDLAGLSELFGDHLTNAGWAPAVVSRAVLAVFDAMTATGSITTGAGGGLVVAYLDESELPYGPTATFVRLRPMNVGHDDGVPLGHVFVLLGPHSACALLHTVAMTVAAIEHCVTYRDSLLLATGPADICEAVARLATGAVRIEEELEFTDFRPIDDACYYSSDADGLATRPPSPGVMVVGGGDYEPRSRAGTRMDSRVRTSTKVSQLSIGSQMSVGFAADLAAMTPTPALLALRRFFIDGLDTPNIVLHRIFVVAGATLALNRLRVAGAVVQTGVTAMPCTPAVLEATPTKTPAHFGVAAGADDAAADLAADLATLRAELRADHADADEACTAQLQRVLGVDSVTAAQLVQAGAAVGAVRLARSSSTMSLAELAVGTEATSPLVSGWSVGDSEADVVVATIPEHPARPRLASTMSEKPDMVILEAMASEGVSENMLEHARSRASSLHADALSAVTAAARAMERERMARERMPDMTNGTSYTYLGLGKNLLAEARRTLNWKEWRGCWSPALAPAHLVSTIAAVIFLSIACITPAISFGALFSALTDGAVGTMECLLANVIDGVVLALISGDFMQLVGSTGPVLILIQTLVQLAKMLPASTGFVFEQHFLAFYSWTCIWTGIILVILAVTGASVFVRYFTRFSNEIFAMMLGILFIMDPFKKLYAYSQDAFRPAPDATDTPSREAAILAILLALGTFAMASTLSGMRRGRYLRPFMRNLLADFSTPLALITFTLVDLFVFPSVKTKSLAISAGAPRPTSPNGDLRLGPDGAYWLVQLLPTGMPKWIVAAAIVPAFVAALMLYIDQHITINIMHDPANKLKRPPAYHYDLLLIGVIAVVAGVLGLPLQVAATVRSISHVRALAVTEETVSQDTHQPEVRTLAVRENRLTPLIIALSNGACMFIGGVLQKIPFFVISGIFIQMGIATFAGSSLFDRLGLLFVEPRLYPPKHMARNVKPKVMVSYTLMQIVLLAVLFAIQASPIALLLPFAVVALIAARKKLVPKLFKPENLAFLDSY